MMRKNKNIIFVGFLVFASLFINGQNSFDINRASLFEQSVLIPFQVEESIELKKAILNNSLTENESVLLVDSPNGRITLLTSQMAYNHVAQGDFNGKPWMASFCIVCNSAMGFSPVVKGKTYHFEGIGIYDGIIILKDKETGSLWNHVTGECLDGELKGKQLKSFNVLHTNVKRALDVYPDITIAIANHDAFKDNPFYQQSIQSVPFFMPNNEGRGNKAELFPQFIKTLGKEDDRLPRMSMGLGVWDDNNYIFYPAELIDADILIHKLGNKRLLIYNDPESFFPIAYYTNAKSFKKVDSNTYKLNNGFTLKNGKLIDKSGKIFKGKKPQQMFSRWYGFSLTFPNTAIYSNNN